VIARLSGRLLSRDAEILVVDVHGVGFRVAVSRLTAEVLPATGETIQLEVHTHVREDAIQLFGFVDDGERQAFEALIGMSGMGPRPRWGCCRASTPASWPRRSTAAIWRGSA